MKISAFKLALLSLACFAGTVAFQNSLFGRLSYLDDLHLENPQQRALGLFLDGRYKDAEDYIVFYESLPGVSAGDVQTLQPILQAVRDKRSTLTYQVSELGKGFFLGFSAEDYGQTASILSNFLVVGDIRDLATAGYRWAHDQSVDAFTAAVSVVGLGLTLLSLGPQSTVVEPAKAGLAILKTAKRVGKIPAALEKDLIRIVHAAAASDKPVEAATEAIKPLKTLADYAKEAGFTAAMEAAAHSDSLAGISRTVRAAEAFGDKGAAALRFCGKKVVPAVEKRGADEVLSVARWGPDAVRQLERMPAKAFLKDMARWRRMTTEALWRAVRVSLFAFQLFFATASAFLFVLSAVLRIGRAAIRKS